MPDISFFLKLIFRSQEFTNTSWLKNIVLRVCACSACTLSVALSGTHLRFHALLPFPSLLKCFPAHNHRLKRVFTPLKIQNSSVRWCLYLLNVAAERLLFGHFSWYGLGAVNHQLLLSLLTLHSGAGHNRSTACSFSRSPSPAPPLFNFTLFPRSPSFSLLPPATLSCFLSFLFFLLCVPPLHQFQFHSGLWCGFVCGKGQQFPMHLPGKALQNTYTHKTILTPTWKFEGSEQSVWTNMFSRGVSHLLSMSVHHCQAQKYNNTEIQTTPSCGCVSSTHKLCKLHLWRENTLKGNVSVLKKLP